jgi:uncharacterized membrane protein YfcA
MGNYLFQFLINLDKRHPSAPTKPLIYWDAVLILFPAELGGANVGIILSAILPNTILYFLAVIVLIIAGGLTLNKGLHLYENETITSSEKQSLLPLMSGGDHGDQDSRIASHNNSYGSSGNKVVASHMASATDNEEQEFDHNKRQYQSDILRSIIPAYMCCYLCHPPRSSQERSETHLDSGAGGFASDDEQDLDLTTELPINTPWVVVQVVLGVWLLYAVCYLVMKDFSTCSAGYYLVLGVIYPLLVLEVVWGMRYLRAQQLEEPESVAEGDVRWQELSYLLPVVAFMVGTLTTLLGIGGGELMGPLLLMAKVLPQVSTATTSIMSLLNSSSSILHYMVLGQVPLDYALLTFLIGSAGGLSGRVGGLYMSVKYGRASFLVFALVAVLAVSFFIYVSYIFTQEVDVSIGSLCD